MKWLGCIALLLILCGVLVFCSGDVKIDRKLAYDISGLTINLDFRSMEYHEYDDGVSTFIKGKLTVENRSGETKTFNAGRVLVLLGDDTSILYYDSIASYIFTDMEMANDSVYTADVYSAFDGRLLPDSLGELRLGYE